MFDRELLAAHFAIRHFRYFLEGRHFTLYTDQDSLVTALRKTANSWTTRQQNQLSAISEYTTNVRHIAGKDNQVADALSRITIDAVEPAQGVDFHAMALAQDSDDDIIHLRNDPVTTLRLENVRLNSTTSLLCDTSTGVQHPVVPASRFRCRPLASWNSHDTPSSHIEVRTTRRLLTSKFVWPRIAADAASWARLAFHANNLRLITTSVPQSRISAPVTSFQSSACWCCRALTTISRILASPHRRRPIHAVAGSHSGERHISAFPWSRAAAELGQPIWHSRAYHIWQRITVHVHPLVTTVHSSGNWTS